MDYNDKRIKNYNKRIKKLTAKKLVWDNKPYSYIKSYLKEYFNKGISPGELSKYKAEKVSLTEEKFNEEYLKLNQSLKQLITESDNIKIDYDDDANYNKIIKKLLTKKLVWENKPYNEIKEYLQNNFGSGVSNRELSAYKNEIEKFNQEEFKENYTNLRQTLNKVLKEKVEANSRKIRRIESIEKLLNQCLSGLIKKE